MLAAYSAIYSCAILEVNMTSNDFTTGQVDRSLKSPPTYMLPSFFRLLSSLFPTFPPFIFSLFLTLPVDFLEVLIRLLALRLGGDGSRDTGAELPASLGAINASSTSDAPPSPRMKKGWEARNYFLLLRYVHVQINVICPCIHFLFYISNER